MKNKIFTICNLFILFFICSVGSLNGQTISKEEAMIKAKQFIKTTFPSTRAVNDSQLQQVNIAKYLYAFNISTGGYVIVSGESTSASIIGYSTSGKISDNLPDNMKAMIKAYENEIKASINDKQSATRVAEINPLYKKPIEPLTKTKWDQDSPYNLLCPPINGYKPPTGCVPTAMAQLMGYYKWPERGHGMLIKSNYDGTVTTLDTMYFDQIPIDWDNILNVNNIGTPEKNKMAIATLMKICGYACGVSYGLSGSGAGGDSPANALKNFFYYKVQKTHQGEFCDVVAYYNFIYNCLNEGKPLICSIVGLGNEGHEMIVDGCDFNGYLHINWGWSGSYNGYFRLNSRKNIGVGVAFGIFDNIIVAEPDYEMKDVVEDNIDYTAAWVGVIKENGTLNYTDTNEDNDVFYIQRNYGYLRNVEFGLRIVVSDTENKYLPLFEINDKSHVITNDYVDEMGRVKTTYIADLTSKLNLSEGRYQCFPMFRLKGEEEWHDCEITIPIFPNCVLLYVKGTVNALTSPNVENTIITVEDKIINIDEYYSNHMIHIFNTYGLCVYSGKENKINVKTAGIYTIKIGDFYKTLLVK